MLPSLISIENFYHADGRHLAIIYRYPMTPFMEVVTLTDSNGEQLPQEDFLSVEELLADGWIFPATVEEYASFRDDEEGWLAQAQPDESEEVVEEEPVGEEIAEPEEIPEGDEVFVTITSFSVEDNGIHTLVLDYQDPDTPVVHSLTGVNDEPLPIPNNLNELINDGFYFPLDEQQFLVFMEDPEEWAITYLPDITGEDIQVIEDDDVEGSDPAIGVEPRYV